MIHKKSCIASCRNPWEWFFLIGGGLVLGGIVFGFIGMSIFANERLQRELHAEVFIVDDEHGEVGAEVASFEQMEGGDKIFLRILASPLTVFVALGGLLLLFLFGCGKEYGSAMGNGVRLDPEQFPEVFARFEKMAHSVGLEKTPDIYLKNGNGALNAFACTVLGYRDMVVIFSDIFERCVYNEDWKALDFILGHELGHIRLGHTKWWYFLLMLPWRLIPFVSTIMGVASTRAAEYSSDKVGVVLSQDDSGQALVMLGAGKYNYRDVDIERQLDMQHTKSFWAWFANILVDHPILTWRIAAVRSRKHGGVFFRRKK